jgi:hypothetical protein
LLKNEDQVPHNVNASLRVNRPFNMTVNPGQPTELKLAALEPVPGRVGCSIHAWMSAWLFVQDHPYVGVSGEDGRIEIANLPQGEWKFRAWHEVPGWLTDVNRDGRKVRWERGQFTVHVTPPETDLGDVQLSPEVFSKDRPR